MNTRLLLASVTFCTMALFQSSMAADFPAKPIRVVIPFTAGGAVDTVMRSIGPALDRELGQPVLIDNRPGAGAQVGAGIVKNAPSDGYTLLAAPGGTFVINPTLYTRSNYDPVRDFQAVAPLRTTPMVLFTSANGKLKDADGFIAALRKGEIFYGSPGPGTAPHIFGHLLSKKFPDARFTHIPYKGAPQAMQAVLANEVDLMFDGVPALVDLVRAGKVVPLAIAAPQRSSLLPQTPTLRELGLPEMRMDLWMGVVTKRGTPPEHVTALQRAINLALSQPETLQRFQDLGYNRMVMSPDEFDRYIRREMEMYRPWVVESGALVN